MGESWASHGRVMSHGGGSPDLVNAARHRRAVVALKLGMMDVVILVGLEVVLPAGVPGTCSHGLAIKSNYKYQYRPAPKHAWPLKQNTPPPQKNPRQQRLVGWHGVCGLVRNVRRRWRTRRDREVDKVPGEDERGEAREVEARCERVREVVPGRRAAGMRGGERWRCVESLSGESPQEHPGNWRG